MPDPGTEDFEARLIFSYGGLGFFSRMHSRPIRMRVALDAAAQRLPWLAGG